MDTATATTNAALIDDGRHHRSQATASAGLEQRFESRLLPVFVRRTEAVSELLPQLYLHGLAQGDFELALRGLLGEGAPLSASSIERLRAKWQLEFEAGEAGGWTISKWCTAGPMVSM